MDPVRHATTYDPLHVNQLVSELDQLHITLKAESGPEDLSHLQKIRRWGLLCGIMGLSTAWIFPNLISAWLISLYRFTAWTMLAHHILHKGYDRVPGVPPHLTSKRFASGWRRWIDWPDWIWPTAWIHEHNVMHHYHLGENSDPDLVELNLQWLRKKRWPLWTKWAFILLVAGMWKYIYYAGNTMHAWFVKKYPDKEVPSYGSIQFWQPFSPTGRRLWWHCFIPYTLLHFVLIPACFLWISPQAALFVLLNMIIAEWMTNFHSFLVIVTNHCGADLPRFESTMQGKADFYVRQITGSVNFKGGSEVSDFLHGYLNYQIEHHLWPDLTMLQYKRAHPQVKAISARYAIPYIQESVWIRLRKTIAIMVGTDSMIVDTASTPSNDIRQRTDIAGPVAQS